MKKIIIAFIGINFFLPVFVFAEDITFALVEWPPVVIVDNDQIDGISVDITREVCKRINVKPKFEVLPLKRAFKYLEEGKVCMASVFYKEERKEFLYYPSEYQYNVKNVIVTSIKNDVKINHIDDLKGKSIGVISGFHYGEAFDKRQDIEKIQINELSDLIKILKHNRVYFIACEEYGFRYKCKQLGIKDKFKIVYTISQKPFYTVFPKKMGIKGLEMAKEFGDTLHKMREEGEIQRIIEKYW